MSTRSGKRIHISFHENTVKSENDFTRSERKTRSKHAKDNFDELNASPRQKKRNYVAYPADDEAGVDTVDSKDEKTSRVLRKNVLKERNVSTTATAEPEVDTRKSVRSTRRTRKFDENSQDAPEVTPRDEEPTKVELSKLKKGKKKKKPEQAEVKLAVPKKKSKKKKGRRSGSLVIEDIGIETPLNKSTMSIDSFHSAAGSPRNLDNCNELVLSPQEVLEAINTSSKKDTHKAEARKTRSSMKLDNTLMEENVTKIEPRKKKSSVKLNPDSDLKDVSFVKENGNIDTTPNREYRKRKISSCVSEDKGNINSTFDVEMLNTSTRKSVRNATFDKTVTPTKINTTLATEETKICSSHKKKKKTILNETLDLKDLTPEEITNNTTLKTDSFTESGHKGKKRMSPRNALTKVTQVNSPLKTTKNNIRKSKVNETFDKSLEDLTNDMKKSITDATFTFTENSSPFKASPIKSFMKETRRISVVNTTFEKCSETDAESVIGIKPTVNETFDLISSPFKSATEVSSPLKMIEDLEHKSIINTTYEKSDTDQEKNLKSVNKSDKDITETKINTTFEKDTNNTADIKIKNTSLLPISTDNLTDIETENFDIEQEKKLDATFDKCSESSSSSVRSSSSSMITLDKSDDSRISITSDEIKNEENILNTTPLLIESSMDESLMSIKKTPTKETTPLKTESAPPVTPLKREGTFTKDQPEVIPSPKPKVSLTKTPTKRMSLPSPGFTPFHVNKSSSKEKSVLLNVTRSIEKRRSSLVEPPRTTKVMFCSPVDNPALLTQNRRKVIKSNLKGSNKSFVFDESVSLESRPANRKRSYTQSDAEDARVKRKRLAGDMQLSVQRLSRPRTSSASAKLAEPTTPSKKPTTPSKKPTTPSKKSDAKLQRTKLPNFAAMHQKQFAKMESLDECQERKARRAKQLLTPTGAINVLERISPKDKAAESEKPKEVPEKPKEPPKKPETPIKSLPTFKSLNPGYTRFGFKLNLDVNPFSIPSKAPPKPKVNKPNGLTRQATLPSMAGATSVRREVAKQAVMREKSFTDRRNVKRTENRTVIKGVRTNRRFELQMRMRDI